MYQRELAEIEKITDKLAELNSCRSLNPTETMRRRELLEAFDEFNDRLRQDVFTWRRSARLQAVANIAEKVAGTVGVLLFFACIYGLVCYILVGAIRAFAMLGRFGMPPP